MFSRIKSISFVGALVLALISPSTPVSVSYADFGIAAINLETEVVFDGSVVEGGVGIYDASGNEVDAQSGMAQTFAALADGSYVVFAQDMNSPLMAISGFELTVASSAVTAFHVRGDSTSPVPFAGGVYQLEVFPANYYLPVVMPDGSTLPTPADADQSEYNLNGELEKFNGAGWDSVEGWASYYESDGGGQIVSAGVKGQVTAAGQYRVWVRPSGFVAAEAVSVEFTVTEGGPGSQVALTTLQLTTPAVSVHVVSPDDPSTAIAESGIKIFDSVGNYLNEVQSNSAFGPKYLAFEAAGTYELEAFTNDAGYSSYAPQKYTVTVVDSSGVLTGTISGESPDANGVYFLGLSSSNLLISAVDPTDSSALTQSVVRVFQTTSNGKEYVTEAWTNDGSTLALNLDDGDYVIDVVPEDGNYLLAQKTYDVSVSGGVATVSFNGGSAIAPDGSGVVSLAVALANITARLIDTDGNVVATDYANKQWINVSLMKVGSGTSVGSDYVGSTDVNEQGYFSFSVAETGAYKIEIVPNGFSNVGSLSELITVADVSVVLSVGDLVLPAPDVMAAVRVPGGSTNLTNAEIEIFSGYEYVGRGSTSERGIASLTFPDVDSKTIEYEVRVNPPRSAFGTARISYTAVVVDDGSTRTVSVETRTDPAVAVTPVEGITILTLGVPTLSGVVTNPLGNVVRNAEVVPIDLATGWEMWEALAVTDAFGRWSMALPEGSYDVRARAPWGDVTFGDGERVGPVAVDTGGSPTSLPAGMNAESFDLSLTNPTWSGTLVDPNDSSQLLTMGNVCLATGSYELRDWNCTQTNSDGQWSLSKPSGFTGFTEFDELIVNEWGTGEFAENRFEGVADIETILGVYIGGSTYENIQLSPKAPNLQITVNAGSGTASRAWVSVENSTSWLGGGETNASGVANIGIPDANLTDELIVQVHIEHVDSLNQDYANTKVVLTNPGASGTRTETVSLLTPNFSVTLSEPSGGSAISYGWIEIMNQDTGEWVGGANTNQSGSAAINLPSSATYDVTVNPSWNGDSSFTKKTYVVVVDGSAVVTSVTGSTIDGDGVYPLVLGTPSLTGLVRDSSGNAQADSWVTPIDHTTQEYLWWLGSNTRSGGQFSMALADGSYYLQAEPSWRNSGDTTSARCSVNISSEALVANADADACAIEGTNAILNLRAPNLSFTLKDDLGAVVPYANVGMFLNEWSVWAQSNRYGVVSLFVSGSDIDAQTTLASGTHDIRIVVEPPYGNGDIARIECNSGDAQSLCDQIPDYNQDTPGTYEATIDALSLTTVSFAAPNTKLRVADENGDPLLSRGSWVTIFEEVGNDLQWVAGANSDSNGWVSFNLDTTKTYSVEVNPGYEKRDLYAQKTYSNLTHAQLTTQVLFGLSTPNFKLKIKTSDGTASSRWGWVGVEEVDANANNDYVDWVGGAGTDKAGEVSLALESSKRYRIILNPGDVTDGSTTRCLFDVDASGVVTSVTGSCDLLALEGGGLWTVKLSAGNVTGTISYNNGSTITTLAGALIKATSGTETFTAVSAADGTYGLELDDTLTWTITAVYARDPSDSNAYVQQSTISVTGDSSAANLTFTAS